ncbi:DUF3108 domain-containing protein [Thiomonas sp.]
MPRPHPPTRARPPSPGGGPGWRLMGVWLALVLVLHALALHALGDAFAPIEPGRLPEPIFARLLMPSARPAPSATPAPTTAAAPHAAEPARGLQLRPASPQAAASRPEIAASQTQTGMGPPPVESAPPVARSLGGGDASGQVAVSRPPAMAPSAPPFPAPAATPTPPAVASSAPSTKPGMQTGTAPGGASQAAKPASAAGTIQPAATTTAEVASSTASAPASTPATTDAFGWPPSTELRYELSGNYRGPLHGDGALLWVRDGNSYRLEISGAALVSFSYTSTGRIDGNWLAPDRYVERIFTRRKAVNFNRDKGTLSFSAISTVMPLSQHLQDSASIFMQLAHQLSTQPQDFRVGQHLAFEVARPSGTTTWDFTILGQDTLQTGVGPLVTWHLAHPADSHGLGAEVWLAPALQNLPVQIRLQQSADNYLLFSLREARQ